MRYRLFIQTLMVILITVGIHAISYYISDIRPNVAASNSAWFWLALYQIIVLITLFGFLQLKLFNKDDKNRTSAITTYFDKNAHFFLIITVVGVILHWSAKLSLLMGDPFESLSQLRHAWLHQPENRPIGLAIRSITGHILSSIAYPGIFFMTSSIVSTKFSKRGLLYLLAFSLISILYALAIVSRSTQLLILVLAFLGATYPYVRGMVTFGKFIRIFTPIGLTLIAMVCFTTFYQFETTIKESTDLEEKKDNVIKYEDGFLKELSLKRVATPTQSQIITRNAVPSSNSFLIYMNHGIYNFYQVLNVEERGNKRLLRFINAYLVKVGLIKINKETYKRVYGPGGVTLPGAAWHDYGAIGLIITALVQGVLIYTCYILLIKKKNELLGIPLYVGLGLSTAVSFLFVGPCVMSFPFILFSIFITSLMKVFKNKFYQSPKKI